MVLGQASLRPEEEKETAMRPRKQIAAVSEFRVGGVYKAAVLLLHSGCRRL